MRLSTSLLSLFLSTQSLLALPTSAFPALRAKPLHIRGSDDAGIGVELEWRAGVIVNPDQRAIDAKNDPAVLAKAKGSTIIVDGKKTFTDEWKLTAEHSPDIDINGLKNMVYEWIVLGEVVKLDAGSNKLPSIAEDIQSSLVSLFQT
jgi:hypothetical protein